MLTYYPLKTSEPALFVKLPENCRLIYQRLNTVVVGTLDAHAQFFLSKKSYIFEPFFFTCEAYPSSTSADDDKATEKDPETNAHGKFSPVFIKMRMLN